MLLDYKVDPSTPYNRDAQVRVEHPRLRQFYIKALKPTADRAAAALLILLMLPALVLIALAIRVKLGRGVFFRQERIGLNGRPFTLIKFRTMLPCRRKRSVHVEIDRRVTHKTEADPRHTPLGRFLRKWSLDELPELINVVAGHMSLVGPRPELPIVVAHYEDWQHLRHLVKPGLTGLWQVSQRGEGPMQRFTSVDIDYVRSIGPGLDARILLTTPLALVKRRGS